MIKTINLHDEITDAVFKRVLGEIKAAGKQKICLSINSPGGSVIAGSAIITSLRGHAPGVEVDIIGLAASMGSAIAMVGAPVRCAANGVVMIHSPWSSATGNAEDLRKEATVLDTFAESLIGVYMAKSKKSRAEIISMMRGETWLTAEQAKANGFVDVITGPSTASASVWSSRWPKLKSLFPSKVSASPSTAEGIAAVYRGMKPGKDRLAFFEAHRAVLFNFNRKSKTK